MSLPFTLPDWLPWWLPIVLLVPALLYLLALLVMPFAVLGVKARLDTIDLRLDEIQGEIRSVALRLREPTERRPGPREDFAPGSRGAEPSVERPRPPIPPARGFRDDDEPGDGRAEPRLNWPR